MATIKVSKTTRGTDILDVSNNKVGLWTNAELAKMAESASITANHLRSHGVCGQSDEKLKGKKKTIDAFECSCGWHTTVMNSGGRRQTLDARIRLHKKICPRAGLTTQSDVVNTFVGSCGFGVKKVDLQFAIE